MINIISFCLYGSKATYILGMKENIILGKKYFPNWQIRIYYNDTVPEKYIKEYNEMGAICIKCENIGKNKMNWEGMFWRFLPLNDENVQCWISRDADSRLSEREFKIVNEWTKSNKTLHCIRDHRCHYNPIMGGMFGINNKTFHERYKFEKIKDIIPNIYNYYKERPYNVDQIFLNDKLWNLLKEDVMSHISNGGRRIYPSDIEIPGVADFVGKQYRLNDFPENIIKKLDKNKGCYWKQSNNPSVYWSNSSTNIKKDIIFKDEGEFYIHRHENGFPQNWSQINVLDGIEEEIKSTKKLDKNSWTIHERGFIQNNNHENPLVSIAISTYESGGKGHELLKHNLDHILKQNYSNIEIVISDHSSDNKIKDLCQKYSNEKYPIIYIHNPHHKGNSSQNTNNAIAHCQGDYIKILFMDDYLYNEQAISIIVNKMQKNPDKKWLVHSYKHTKNYKDFYNLHHPKLSNDIALCNKIGCPSCLTIHASVKERFDEKLKWYMDSELYKRLYDKYSNPIFIHTKDDEIPYMINLHHANQVTNTSINNELINKEKCYINNYCELVSIIEPGYTTDKGGFNEIHSYLKEYNKLFKPIKESCRHVLEIGVRTGASIKLWSDYFTNADIYGIDVIDSPNWLKSYERVKLFKHNAYDIEFIKREFINKGITFDIIIEDGAHTLHTQIFTAIHYPQLLKKDGILIIEDIQKDNHVEDIIKSFENKTNDNPKLVDIRKNMYKYRHDNMFILYKNKILKNQEKYMSNKNEEYYNLLKTIEYPYKNDVPIFNTHGKLIIALFEFRPIDEIKYVINAILQVYNSIDIGFSIVYGKNNEKYIQENFGNWKNILLINTNDGNHNSHSYSNRLITPELWENFLNWKHVLVYQCDALILRKIPDIYFKYDYIGAPWSRNNLAGNGGFSLRNVKSIIKVCEPYRNKNITEFKCPHMHEDGFFCRQEKADFVYPNKNERELHKEFCIEGIFNENPIGLHKCYQWIDDKYVKGGDEQFNKIIENIKTKLLINKKPFKLHSDPFISDDYFVSKSNLLLLNKINIEELNQIIKYKSYLTICIQSNLVEYYLDFLLNIDIIFTLITNGAGDRCFPYVNYPCTNNNLKDKYDKILKKENLIRWYTINPSILHKKIIPIPLGNKWRWCKYDFFSENKENTFNILNKYCKNAEENFLNKKSKTELLYFGSMNLTTTNTALYKPHINSRNIIFNVLKDKFKYNNNNRLSFEKYLIEMSKCKFVICPPGRGIDTHRCWESLMVGSIPIMYHTPIDPLFDKLPVLLIDDYSILTEEYLNEQYEIIIKKEYDFSILYTDYWDKEFENNKYLF